MRPPQCCPGPAQIAEPIGPYFWVREFVREQDLGRDVTRSRVVLAQELLQKDGLCTLEPIRELEMMRRQDLAAAHPQDHTTRLRSIANDTADIGAATEAGRGPAARYRLTDRRDPVAQLRRVLVSPRLRESRHFGPQRSEYAALGAVEEIDRPARAA